MPWAHFDGEDSRISRAEISGGVEISEQEYVELRDALMAGREFIIRDGAPVLLSLDKRTVWSTDDLGRTQEIPENADTPEGWTEQPWPGDGWIWGDGEWIKDPDWQEPPYGLAKLTIIRRLDAAGKLDDALDLLADPANRKLKAKWDAAVVIESDHPDTDLLRAGLEQIDGLDVDAILAPET